MRAALAKESFHKIEENREGRKTKFARVLEEDPDVVFKEMSENFRHMEKNMLKAQEEMKAQMEIMSRCTPTNVRQQRRQGQTSRGCYLLQVSREGALCKKLQSPGGSKAEVSVKRQAAYSGARGEAWRYSRVNG